MMADVGDLEKILTKEQLEQYKKEFKIENDPRVTRIGGMLRRTSLDELPQLINILKGELTLVGPRPIVEKETEIYGDRLGEFLQVRPGLTGYWQAYARNRATYESGERQEMELHYAGHSSLWFDIKILCRTVIAVIRKDGAM
jgi:lipopolysaccharide/colanic/teichoic acid biosynthesis glycosyltransferase